MKFYFYEVYKDEAARLAHREMPHFAEWAKFMKHGLDREIIRHSTTNFHPPDAEWQHMLIFAEIEALHCPRTRRAGFLFLVDMCNFGKVQRLACYLEYGLLPPTQLIIFSKAATL